MQLRKAHKRTNMLHIKLELVEHNLKIETLIAFLWVLKLSTHQMNKFYYYYWKKKRKKRGIFF